MEYVDGYSLRTKIDKGASDIDEVLDITKQICEGLTKAHQADIVHRDIKPENILIDNDGRAKILDFGLAKLKGVSKLTKETSTLGTIHYMSPEQLQGKEVDNRSDIWSLGVVLYELLTCEVPFTGDYEQAVTYAILNEESHEIQNISPEIQQIVMKTLAKQPLERYQSTNAILDDINSIQNKYKGAEVKQTISQRKSFYAYASIAVIIALITFIGILFFPELKREKTLTAIAVLPFSNSKPDIETDYFGFAIADQIIGDLSYLRNIIIRPSSSIRKYEKQVVDSKAAAHELNVGYIVAGNFLMEGNTIRLNVELV